LQCYLLKYPPLSAILLLILFSSLFAPVISDMGVGNINQIQLLIISLFILLAARSKPWWSGISIGIGIMLKPNMLPIWLFYNIALCIDKRYRYQLFHLLGTGFGILLAAILPVIFFSKPAIWFQFFKSLPTLGGFSYPIQNGNFGLPVLIFELTAVHTAIIIAAVLISTFVWIMIGTRKKTSPNARTLIVAENCLLHETFAVAGMGIAVMLLSSNLAWLHYYILLIPLVIFLLRPDEGKILYRPLMQMAVQGGAAAALLLFSTVTPYVLWNTFSQAVAFSIATALLMVGTMYELWRIRSGSPVRL